MDELNKFVFKIIAIPNGLEKYMSISLDIKLVFTDRFRYLSSSLDSLVKNIGEISFSLLSQEFDSEVLDLVKQKEFHLYEYMSRFEKFQDTLCDKNECYSWLSGNRIIDKEC